jgi:hypothetical protein
MPCDDQVAKLLYKRYHGVSDVDTNRPYYAEKFRALERMIDPNVSIWSQSSSIPTTASAYPAGVSTSIVNGVITSYSEVTLLPVSGAPNAFYHVDLIDAIPFNFSTDWSYRPIIKDNTGTITYKFTEADWNLDNAAGTLVFYKNMPAGISAALPPKLSYHRYTGLKGIQAPATPLGNPSSGTYSYALRLENDMSLADALLRLELVVSEFTTAPKDTSDLTLVLADVNQYQANLADGAVPTATVTVTNDLQPNTAVSDVIQYGDVGILHAFIDGAAQGTVDMSTGDNTGQNNTALFIDSDYDLFATSNAPGIYQACTLHMEPQAPLATSATPHTYQVKQDGMLRGGLSIPSVDSNLLSFIVDTPAATPFIFSNSITAIAATLGTTTVSGVPRFNAGATITVTFTASLAVSKTYHATRVAEVFSDYTSNASYQPASAIADTSLSGVNTNVTLNAGVYHANIPISVIAYTSNNNASTTALCTTAVGAFLEVDTNAVSLTESTVRVKSNIGQFPVAGVLGTLYVSADLLSTNEELQMVNGGFQYPTLDYSGTFTVGPDYSTGTLVAATYNTMRWVTFDLGAITTTSTITLNINGTTNWPATTVWPSTGLLADEVDIYITTDNGTTWFAGNKAFDPYETITNGVGALVVRESSPTVRSLTRGTTSFSGNLLVRVGIKNGSTASFATVSL